MKASATADAVMTPPPYAGQAYRGVEGAGGDLNLDMTTSNTTWRVHTRARLQGRG